MRARILTRILAGIQAAVLVLSSFPTTAGVVWAEEQIVAIEAETEDVTESETETGEEPVSESETSFDTMSDTTGGYLEGADSETQEEMRSERETETEDATESETEGVTGTKETTEEEEQTETEEMTEEEEQTETEEMTEEETEEMTEEETEETTEEETESETEEQIVAESVDSIDTDQYLTTIDAAGEKLRESLTERETEIAVYYQTTDALVDVAANAVDDELVDEIVTGIWNAALEHTGKPTEGDYLQFQCGGYKVATSLAYMSGEESVYYVTITYTMTDYYYTTSEQETALDTAVEQVLTELSLDGKSDYQKIKAVYDWICENVAYDNDNLSNDEYTLKYTAYAALVNKTAVCQGYANLLYRLLLECGIDARIISGTATSNGASGNHAWNIVKYNGSYYYLDATWDAGKTETGYSYFLKGSDNFSGHTAGDTYTSTDFTSNYPISTTDAVETEDADDDGEENGNGEESGENTGDGTESGDGTETDTGEEDDTTGKDGQTSNDTQDKRPSLNDKDEDGNEVCTILFPGRKLDDYSTTYTGEQIRPTMTVTYTYTDSNGKSKTQTLKLNVDYTVTYSDNVDVGTATVTVKGIGEYKGTVTRLFSITQKSISGVTLSSVGDMVYSENLKDEIQLTVMDGTKVLEKDKDYTIELSPLGSATEDTVSTLTVNGIGNYTGTSKKSVKFNILAELDENSEIASIGSVNIAWKNPSKIYTYNGKAQKPAVVVTDKDGNKVKSSYYKVIYANNVNAGTDTAEVYVVGVTKKGKGYYGVSEALTFTIAPKSFSKVSASIKGTFTKSTDDMDSIKAAIRAAITVKDGKHVLSYDSEDESKSEYRIDCGELENISVKDIVIGQKYTITLMPVTGTGKNYTEDANKTKTLKVKFGQINLASKTAKVSLTVTSAEYEKVTLVYNGNTLEQDTDYTVTSIQPNQDETYTVKVKGIGAYKGSLTFKDALENDISGTDLLENYVSVTDFGAVADDGEEDTDAFNQALKALGNGDYAEYDTVYVPAGTYHIEPGYGIHMQSNTKLYMDEEAVLQAIQSSNEEYQVIGVLGESDVEICGGTIIGDLQEAGASLNSDELGEGGMGIRLQYAENVYIHDVTVKECRGDGIYIGGNGTGSSNITIENCTVADNRRNGIGIVSAHNLTIDSCTITGAGSLYGTDPRACIFVATYDGDAICTDIVITNSTIDNKEVCEKYSEAYAFGSAWKNYPSSPAIQADRLTVENCTFRGTVANYSVTNATFTNCTFDGTTIWEQETVVQ